MAPMGDDASATQSGADDAEHRLIGAAHATVVAAADQNGVGGDPAAQASNEAADALLHGPQAAEVPTPGSVMEGVLARLDAAEKALADHAGTIDALGGLIQHLGDKNSDLATKLESIVATVEQLAPISDDDRKTIADGVAFAKDLASLMPRLATIEAKLKHWF